MSGFALKITALISMLTDHCAFMLYMRGYIETELYIILRSIGRLAFPIYCFLLVQGFYHSSDLRKYSLRLMLFALLSQLPFTMLFCIGNYSAAPGMLTISGPSLLYIFIGFGVFMLELWQRRGFWETVISVLFALLPGVRLKLGSFFLLDANMNVFYTLALGLMLLSLCRDEGRKLSSRLPELLILSALIFSAHYDYGLGGILLIIFLAISGKRRFVTALSLVLWALVQYGFEGSGAVFCLFACLSLMPIFLYNRRRGPGCKYFFYAAYPIHLFILGLIAFCI